MAPREKLSVDREIWRERQRQKVTRGHTDGEPQHYKWHIMVEVNEDRRDGKMLAFFLPVWESLFYIPLSGNNRDAHLIQIANTLPYARRPVVQVSHAVEAPTSPRPPLPWQQAWFHLNTGKTPSISSSPRFNGHALRFLYLKLQRNRNDSVKLLWTRTFQSSTFYTQYF